MQGWDFRRLLPAEAAVHRNKGHFSTSYCGESTLHPHRLPQIADRGGERRSAELLVPRRAPPLDE